MVFLWFTVTAITAPVLGAISSGIICSYLGGYEGKWTLPSALIAAVVCMGASIAFPLLDNFPTLVVLIWILLFMGGYILPLMTGIMLQQVDNYQKPLANSIANFSYNMFGYMPAPIIYGFLCTLDPHNEENQSRWGMFALMYITIPCFFCMIIVLFKQKKVKKLSGLPEVV